MFNKNQFNFFKLLLVCALMVGCGLWPQKEVKKIVISYPPELEAVNKMIIEKKTDDAKIKVDDYLNKSENIHWFGHAYFLKAFLHEIDGNYDLSIKEYRSAIQHSASYNSRVEAKALYNLSFVYERVKNMPKLTTTLVDLMKRRGFFDELTGYIETPARLAASYAYLGKTKEALIFHREAATHFNEKIRKNNFRTSKDEISKSLHYLGLAIYTNSDDSFKALITKVKPGQKYFFSSAEAAKGEWAEKSTNQLLDNYTRLWRMIEVHEAKGYDHDSLAKKKQTQTKQLEMAADMYDLIHQLKAEEFPMGSVNSQSRAIIDKSNKWLRKLENFAMNLDLGPVLIRSTPVKQRKLMRHIDKPVKPVRINKESVVGKKIKLKMNKKLPEKKESDPNL